MGLSVSRFHKIMSFNRLTLSVKPSMVWFMELLVWKELMEMLDLADGLGLSIKPAANRETANKKVADALFPLQNQ